MMKLLVIMKGETKKHTDRIGVATILPTNEAISEYRKVMTGMKYFPKRIRQS